ncbi:MAG: hypothetical protein EOO04_24070 [Chitinophagaceae bacterium]|nr:MAG: hypothetical protein EOO04_24070 [Chitinophagaceae bacterium]
MRFLSVFLPAIILLSCAKPGNNNVVRGTAITGWDGITVIKAFQKKYSNHVEVHLMMRPEMKKNIYVLWYSIDTEHKTRRYKSALRKGQPVGIFIAVSPGSRIREIHISGYQKVAA